MKIKDVFKTVIKFGPVVYPVVKKMLTNRKDKTTMATRRK